MGQKSSSTSSKKKRSSPRNLEKNAIMNADPLNNQIPAQNSINAEHPNIVRSYLFPILGWFLVLSVGMIIVGLLIQDINQPLDALRWLLYRTYYPYFQAITFASVLVTSSVVIPGVVSQLVNIDELPWFFRLILRLLLKISSGYKNNGVWTILFSFFLIFFVLSLSFPRCLSSDAILVSFDIFDNGALVHHVSPGETIFYEPARYIDIEVKLEANLFNLPPPRVNCEWATYTGDGKSRQVTNCKINYQTGSDERPDPVVVNLTQKSCPFSLGYYSFFISSAK